MEIERTKDYIAVHGDFTVLSSAVYNGGFVNAKTILNITVDNGFDGNAFAVFDSLADTLHLARGEVVGLMTAVAMEHAVIVENGELTAIITAGLRKPLTESSSTVNIILLINKNLSRSAMANAIIVTTEAKAAAFFDLDVRYPNGELATGDATDAVVVACYGREHDNEELFAGKATELGKQIYETVKAGVKNALYNYNGLRMDRPILERLEERGIYIDDMVATALKLYVPVAGEDEDKEDLKPKLEAMIKRECADANVALLLAAALHAEEHEIRKGRAGDAAGEDAACIVADELIGIDIAEYIGGNKTPSGKFRKL